MGVFYVFDVERGCFYGLQLEDALENVRMHVRQHEAVKVEHMIFLTDSGQVLRPRQICRDINPTDEVFFFDVGLLRRQQAPQVAIRGLPNDLILPTTTDSLQQALQQCTKFAQDCKIFGDELFQICGRLSKDMQMQLKGWYSAKKNLEIHIEKFNKEHSDFSTSGESIMEEEEEILSRIPECIEMLSNLKVPDAIAPPQVAGFNGSLAECFERSHTGVTLEKLKKMQTEYHRLRDQLSSHSMRSNESVKGINDMFLNEKMNPLQLPSQLSEWESQYTDAWKRHLELAQMMLTNYQGANNDHTVLSGFVQTHHQHVIPELHRTDQMLREFSRGLNNLKIQYSAQVHERMRVVMAVQQQIKMFKREYSIQGYSEAKTRASHLMKSLNRVVKLPHAFIAALQEIARRNPFGEKYTKLVESARTRLQEERQKEISARQKFHQEHGRYLPTWPAFAALDDYPHACMAELRPFDTQLARLSIEDCIAAVRGLPDVSIDDMPFNEDFTIDTDEGRGASLCDSSAVSTLQEQIIALNCECEALQENVDALKEERDAALTNTKTLSDAARAKDKRIAELEKGHEDNHALHESETAASTQSLEGKVSELQAQLDAAKQELKEQAEREDKSKKQAAEIEELRKKNAELQAEKSKVPPLSISASVDEDPKLTFTNFKVGDLALFLPWRRSKKLVAFSRKGPHRILRRRPSTTESSEKATYFVGKITKIVECVAATENEYQMDVGTKFFEVEADKYEPTPSTPKSPFPLGNP